MASRIPGPGEGSIVAIPLDAGDWGMGMIARANGHGHLVVYFQSGRAVRPDLIGQLPQPRPEQTLAVAQVSDLALRRGRWSIAGTVTPWLREEWRQSTFVRYEELTGRSFEVRYDDHDCARVIDEREISPGTDEQGPSDDLRGSASAEAFLKRLLQISTSTSS